MLTLEKPTRCVACGRRHQERGFTPTLESAHADVLDCLPETRWFVELGPTDESIRDYVAGRLGHYVGVQCVADFPDETFHLAYSAGNLDRAAGELYPKLMQGGRFMGTAEAYVTPKDVHDTLEAAGYFVDHLWLTRSGLTAWIGLKGVGGRAPPSNRGPRNRSGRSPDREHSAHPSK